MESQRSQSSKSKQTTKRKAPVPESADILTSIACRRCRLKKIKCDPGLPSCHPCERNASECVVFDSTTGETHERRQVLGYMAAREREKLLLTTVSYLSAMQAKTNKLEALLSRRPLDAVTARPDQDQQRAPKRMSRYVGDESGNRFMEHAITDMDQISTENSLPRPFRDCLEEARVTYVPPHPFPQYTQSLKLIEEYMRRFHPIHPILSQAYIWELHRRLYPDYQAPQQNDLNDDERFKLLMAFALGSVGSHSAGKQDEHPFGYFAAALESLLASGFAFSTLSELQNFLLIARFGTFHYIGCSIWELGQVCVRMAIELGLHQHSDIDPSLGHEEQMRRRVFWDCYHLDRMSSSTLGRPFGIADSDIRMQLPTDVDRNGIEATAITEQENFATDLTMFRQTIRLMQIESAIRTSLLPQKSGSKLVLEPENHVANTDYGHLYEIFHVHSQALHDWWISRPPPSVTQGVYQAPEYLCFLYRRKKLDLARAILGQAWKSNIRSRELLRGCLGTALSLLSLFSIVHLKEAVTYTRGFVHLIFSTGMSIIHTCVELLRDSGAAASVNSCADIEAWWADGFQEISSCLSPHDVTDGLSLALDLLRSMSNYIPHTLQYTQAFEHLKAKFEAYLRSIGHDRILCAINSESRRPADIRLDENGSHDAQVRTSAGGQGIFDPAQDLSSHIGLQGVVVPQPEGASFPLRMEDASIPNRYDEGANDFWDVPFDLSDGAENNPWAYAPPMEQLNFDLLDYTWEAPILWQDYPVE